MSAHEIVCHDPSVRESSPPSAYPIAHTTTAAKSSRSEVLSPTSPSPWMRAKPTAATAPRAAATQKAREGRSPVRSTAHTAVTAGSTAMTTAP